MRSDDRRDLATATVGAGGLAAGGLLRHGAVESMKKKPKVHLVGVLRNGSKAQRRVFLGGSALGLASTAPLGVGVSRLATGREVSKAEEKRGFLSEGLRGSAQALKGRGESALQPVPAGVRATQLGIAAGAGLGGSALTRAALRGKGRVVKPVVAPIAGGLAAAGSLPVSNRAIADRGYTATAYGVRRSKTAAKKPSSKAQMVDQRHGPQRMQIVPSDQRFGKAESYLGARTGYGVQRAAVTAAGHPPIVGPLTAAAAAGKYAPPGQERKHALRQYGMGSVVPAAIGVGGAYGGAKWASSSARGRKVTQGVVDTKNSLERRGRAVLRLGEKKPVSPSSFRGRSVARLSSSRAGRPLTKNPVGALGGFLGAKAAAGAVLGQTAITMNQRDQKRYNARAGISKSQSKREKHQLADRKRTSAALSAVGGTAGLAGVGLLLARKKSAATTAGIIGGGFGGTNALLTTPIQRAEAQAIAPVKKFDGLRIQRRAMQGAKVRRMRSVSPDPVRGQNVETRTKNQQLDDALAANRLSKGLARLPWDGPKHVLFRGKKARVLEYHGDGKMTVLGHDDQRYITHRDRVTFTTPKKAPGAPVQPQLPFTKRDSLEIKHKAEHPTLLRSYGDKGPLPKGLDRDTKMKAYEARYVAHGGDRADKYGRRAEAAEGVRNAGLAGATVGGAAWLAARTKRGAKVAGHMTPKIKRKADTVAVGAATAGGGAELYGEYARGRRASYTNSPAGVAGSALRRMRDYTPD